MKDALRQRNQISEEERQSPAQQVRQQLESLQRNPQVDLLGPHVQNLFASLQHSIREQNACGDFEAMPLPQNLQAVIDREWILSYLSALHKRTIRKNQELRTLLAGQIKTDATLKQLLLASLAEEDDVSKFISALSNG